ncbi:MAG: hypothetical protein FKY71_17255 [Spiribacter salinus]|uniref:Uncharacterized protein n=1 Tax=Spiribacter salinus TaxID=1335746 RepID=A0A540VEN3_9GAMM|nr:MAG: hypothetical protein FKY71_17255 [Spiribacter salinus]
MPRMTQDDWNLTSALVDAGEALQALNRLSPEHPAASLADDARDLVRNLVAIPLGQTNDGAEAPAEDAKGDDTDAGESNDATA